MPRPSKDEHFLRMAALAATQGTCARRQVGCVLTDVNGRVLGTGCNGPPSGWPHCTDTPCPGARAKTGESLDMCEAVHAEMNALLYCADVSRIATCYCTVSPCLTCVKLLINTPCRRIVFIEEYAHSMAKARWMRMNRADQYGALPLGMEAYMRRWEQVHVDL